MAFNNALPADTTKLRVGPSVIRDNFVAIEDGDSSFKPVKINFAVQGADPVAIADSLLAFSKDDSDGVAQLFTIAENNDVEQLSGNLSSHTLNAGGGTYYTYKIPGALGIILKFGQCNSNTGGGTQVTYEVGDNFPTATLGVLLTVKSTQSITYWVDTFTASGFKAFNSNGSITSHFLAWGN